MAVKEKTVVLDEKIVLLKDKLNKSIENQSNYDKIYKLSTELDELIVSYYRQKYPVNEKTS
ncbi:aspartyl-phosphate phosphatase Spo0E family protein [Caldisalinibacter kiritimatiensis]|uniref:Spo0E like sporulation regulatory protein n=1 Tax=Caldisalinibacter kiritimatiensis TaxID=1304284 RepID=R1AX53_9FIRM|nr:aspartyl-phosphate phosphatase Spo0E family protein [Caldisalinibacter kiritimatiensis]EOD01252.1 hypothetical protein L21TH_0606 [Caldisalinibacter kiritimatiensis]